MYRKYPVASLLLLGAILDGSAPNVSNLRLRAKADHLVLLLSILAIPRGHGSSPSLSPLSSGITLLLRIMRRRRRRKQSFYKSGR